MPFTFDENNVGVKPIEAGEYEVYANAYSVEQAKSGNQMIQLNYFIRDDVDQAAAGQEIRFDNFVVTPNSQWRFNALAKAVGTPQGYDFGSPEGWAQAMMGRPVRVIVEMEKSNNGREYPRVKVFNKSSVPMNVQPVFKESQQQRAAKATAGYNSGRQSMTQMPNTNSYQQQNNQQNFGRDPFDSQGQPIDITDNDLPF